VLTFLASPLLMFTWFSYHFPASPMSSIHHFLSLKPFYLQHSQSPYLSNCPRFSSIWSLFNFGLFTKSLSNWVKGPKVYFVSSFSTRHYTTKKIDNNHYRRGGTQKNNTKKFLVFVYSTTIGIQLYRYHSIISTRHWWTHTHICIDIVR